MSKVDLLHGGDWRPIQYGGIYELQRIHGALRLMIAASGGHQGLVRELISVLRAPFAILYVLHTPRGGGHPGRYQSPPLELADVLEFLRLFGSFLAADSRHDLWVRSRSDSASVIWERHDMVYAYGPVERFEDVLTRRGLRHGVPGVPTPHRHHYYATWDATERAVLQHCEWRITGLRPEDIQQVDPTAEGGAA